VAPALAYTDYVSAAIQDPACLLPGTANLDLYKSAYNPAQNATQHTLIRNDIYENIIQ